MSIRAPEPVTVIGGGLAGVEAAMRLAAAGVPVRLCEMRPGRMTPAHRGGDLAELVCSNSLRSDDPDSAAGLLKREMERLGSLVMRAARATAVPAGKALAVDREAFSRFVTRAVEAEPRVTVVRQEQVSLPDEGIVVLAAGPLASDGLADEVARLAGTRHLHFWDAIAPVVHADSIDRERVFRASRWGAGDDYLNCPMDEEEYGRFFDALTAGETVPLHDFEKPKFFEGCLPIEVMAARGRETLRFGPMKPVGLDHPLTGRRHHAVVQLRAENRQATLWNIVGFQTRLTPAAQLSVLRLIPGLERAVFARLGSIHRNTYLDAPRVLGPCQQFLARPEVVAAGQISGVEGYLESASSGLLAGIHAARLARGITPVPPPPETAIGALAAHLSDTTRRHFEPTNVTFGLLPPADATLRKNDRPAFHRHRALRALEGWIGRLTEAPATAGGSDSSPL